MRRDSRNNKNENNNNSETSKISKITNNDSNGNSIRNSKRTVLRKFVDSVLRCDSKKNKNENSKLSKISNNDPIENVSQKLVYNDVSSKENMLMNMPPKEPPLTLDDILNLWDGLKETPGRMLGISSNHYDKLDPALIRPGRIDVTIHLNNTTRDIIEEMFTHYYKIPIDVAQLKRIHNEFYSPAEIINCYSMFKDEPEKFMERLAQNKKF